MSVSQKTIGIYFKIKTKTKTCECLCFYGTYGTDAVVSWNTESERVETRVKH